MRPADKLCLGLPPGLPLLRLPLDPQLGGVGADRKSTRLNSSHIH